MQERKVYGVAAVTANENATPLALHMNLYANDAEINILEKQQEVHLVEGKNTSWQWRRKMIINNKAERNYVNIPRATF